MVFKLRINNMKLKKYNVCTLYMVGGWGSAPDGPYAWGYCYVNATIKDSFCSASSNWPCAPGKQYYGRGPFQII